MADKEKQAAEKKNEIDDSLQNKDEASNLEIEAKKAKKQKPNIIKKLLKYFNREFVEDGKLALFKTSERFILYFNKILIQSRREKRIECLRYRRQDAEVKTNNHTEAA
jgi:hypothetical protein